MICPPLTINEAEIEEMLTSFEAGLHEFEREAAGTALKATA